MNNSIPIDVVTLFQPEYLAFPGLRQKLALLVAKSIPRHRPQVTRTRWVWPASERLNPLTRRDYVKTHVWVFWKNQPIPERILLFMPWFLQITNKWLIKHVEKLHAFWIKCFPTKIMCFNRKIPCLPTVADKQGIRLKMHEMAILETLILKKFWGGDGRSYKHIWPAFWVLKLGVYAQGKWSSWGMGSLDLPSPPLSD